MSRQVTFEGERLEHKQAQVREALDVLQAVARAGLKDAGGSEVLPYDYHRLSSAQVDVVLSAADAQKYRKPRNANGSRGRYFYDRLQRLAAYETLLECEPGSTVVLTWK